MYSNFDYLKTEPSSSNYRHSRDYNTYKKNTGTFGFTKTTIRRITIDHIFLQMILLIHLTTQKTHTTIIPSFRTRNPTTIHLTLETQSMFFQIINRNLKEPSTETSGTTKIIIQLETSLLMKENPKEITRDKVQELMEDLYHHSLIKNMIYKCLRYQPILSWTINLEKINT